VRPVAAGPEPAEVRQERITALVEEQGFVRVSDLSARAGGVTDVNPDASADPSILADLAAVDCDVDVAEEER
jgi:hypothetical protein